MKDVRLMTICSNADGEFAILSNGLPGSVAHYENEITFLKEALKFLEDKSAESRKRNEELKSSFEFD